jgi:voltage-gated potassium channel
MIRVVRSGLSAAAMVILYAFAPVGAVERPVVAWLVFAAGFGALLVLLASLVRQQRSAPSGAEVRIEWIVLVAYAVIAFFALVYVHLAQRPGQFVGLDDRIDALYFTVSTLATVGYGDVHPTGSAAQVVVTTQIFFDVTFLAFAVRVIGPSILPGRADPAVGSPSPGDVGDPPPADAGGDPPSVERA